MKNDLSAIERFRAHRLELIHAGVPGGNDAGIFEIPSHKDGKPLRVIFSRGFFGWDHVSISRRDRVPNWYEMCQMKDVFFDDEEAVMQLHPPRSQWISNSPNCLHLFRPVEADIPMPPPELVGVQGVDTSKLTPAERQKIQDESYEKMKARQGTVMGVNVQRMITVENMQALLNGHTLSLEGVPDQKIFGFRLVLDHGIRPGELQIVATGSQGRNTQPSRLYRPQIGVRDLPVEDRRAPNSIIQAMSPDERAASEIPYDEFRRRMGVTRPEEERDDMDEDLQALMDRDRE